MIRSIMPISIFFLSETKKIILIKEQIQERKKRQKKKTKGRMRGPSYTNTKEKHPTIEL